jgi:DHA1 family bicyclomycin/chloramphenicol resistance-like MFS transporter
MPASPAVGARSVPAPGPLFVGLLIALTATAPLAVQIFLPALPAIQAYFGVSTGIAQLVFSLSIFANAIAMLAFGPLSDRFGRRPTIIFGMLAFTAGSALAALAPDVWTLIFARILQSIGGAAGMVLARAVVRDLYDRERAAQMIAYLIMAMVVAPMLAPTIGALLTDGFGWRAVFWFTTAVAVVLTLLVIRHLFETRPPEAGAGGFGLLGGASHLLRQPAFLAYTLQSSFAISVFFSFLGGAPYFMVSILGRPATEYGLYFILVSGGFMAGNFASARITQRVGLDRMIWLGSVLALAGVLVATLLLGSGLWQPAALFGPMMIAGFANGLSVPNAQAGAVSVDPGLAGTASGLAGFGQMFMAGVVSQAVGMLQDGTPHAMLAFMTGCAVLSVVGFVVPLRLAGR